MAEHISPIGHLAQWNSLPNFTTTVNTMATVGNWHCPLLRTKRLRFTASTNNLTVQILGSFDGGATFPITVVTAFAVNVGTPVVQTITDWYSDLQVQVQPAVAGNHGTLATQYGGATI